MRPPMVYPVYVEPPKRPLFGYEESPGGVLVPQSALRPEPPPRPTPRGRPPKHPAGQRRHTKPLRRRDDEVGVRTHNEYIRAQKGRKEHYTDEFALRPHCAWCGGTNHRGTCRDYWQQEDERDLMDEDTASWWEMGFDHPDVTEE